MAKRGRTSKARHGFSVVKAVKENARTQVGQPRAVRVLPSTGAARPRQKHKTSLAQTLAAFED